MNYTFEKWWKSYGKYEDIVSNDLKNEQLYKKFAEKVWNSYIDNSNECCESSCGCRDFVD